MNVTTQKNNIQDSIFNIPFNFSHPTTKKSTINFINHHSQKVIYKGSQIRKCSTTVAKARKKPFIDESSLIPRRVTDDGQARLDGKQESNVILEYIDETVNFIKGEKSNSPQSSDRYILCTRITQESV